MRVKTVCSNSFCVSSVGAGGPTTAPASPASLRLPLMPGIECTVPRCPGAAGSSECEMILESSAASMASVARSTWRLSCAANTGFCRLAMSPYWRDCMPRVWCTARLAARAAPSASWRCSCSRSGALRSSNSCAEMPSPCALCAGSVDGAVPVHCWSMSDCTLLSLALREAAWDASAKCCSRNCAFAFAAADKGLLAMLPPNGSPRGGTHCSSTPSIPAAEEGRGDPLEECVSNQPPLPLTCSPEVRAGDEKVFSLEFSLASNCAGPKFWRAGLMSTCAAACARCCSFNCCELKPFQSKASSATVAGISSSCSVCVLCQRTFGLPPSRTVSAGPSHESSAMVSQCR
mmetsp:Transcript_84900/g.124221  ORF Transcript_84900/g.124221 Transcript_84900/m.124221 type:complete len:346 (+) Transcript_84900:2539-3576(+)